MSGSIANRSLWLGLVLVAFGGVACIAPPPYRQQADFEQRFEAVRTMTLVPPKIAVYKMSAGDMEEEVQEWSDAAHAHVIEAVKAEVEELGRIYVPFAGGARPFVDQRLDAASSGHVPGAVRERTPAEDSWLLFEAANLAILRHTYDPLNTFPMRMKDFGYTLGPEAASLLGDTEADAFLLVVATDYRLDTSGLLFEDPDLEAYLQEVALRLAGDTLAEGGVTPRVRVLSNPDMNAFAFPNGVIYVHTALLARMDNEAQLATMLSRELVHVIQRHGLMKHRSDRATGNLMAASGLLLSGVKGGGNAKLLLQAGSFSSMAGYAHALEMSADARGLEMMDRLGYDLEEAPKLFEKTIAYLEEVKAQRPPSPLPFAFSTPVHVTHRIGNYRKLLSTRFADSASLPGSARNTEVFRRNVRRAVVHEARPELDRGRFDSAAITIERAIEVDAADPDAWVILGEARERSNGTPDTEAAIEAYERALALDRAHAGAHRALGLLYYRDVKNGGAAPERGAAARVHLARYLEVAPDAPDAGHVRAYLSELGAARDAGPAPSASGGSS